MSTDLYDVSAYIDEHADQATCQLRRQPGVAAQSIAMKKTAAIVEGRPQRVERDTRQVVSAGYPVAHAEQLGGSSQALSCYSHHDLQPSDPLDEWGMDPWSAEIRGGSIFAHGVADNKGNIAARVAAIRARQAGRGELRVGVKFINDGEKETGSPSLKVFALENRDLCAGIACIREIGGRGTSSAGSLESTPARTGRVTPGPRCTRPARASTLTTSSSWE